MRYHYNSESSLIIIIDIVEIDALLWYWVMADNYFSEYTYHSISQYYYQNYDYFIIIIIIINI